MAVAASIAVTVGRHLRHLIDRFDVHEILAPEIIVADGAENVVENRSRILDDFVALHRARRLEAGEGEAIHQLFERHTVLERLGSEHGEAVEQPLERRALLVHVDEHLAQRTIFVLAGSEEHLVAADVRLANVAFAALRQHPALGAVIDALDNALLHLFRPLGLVKILLGTEHDDFILRRGIGDVERLRELGAVAIDGNRLDHRLPCGLIDVTNFSGGSAAGHVDRFGDRPRDKRLHGGHHAHVRHVVDVALAFAAAGAGAVENRQVLRFEVRRALDHHGAADVVVSRLDVLLRRAKLAQHVERRFVELLFGEAEGVAELLADDPLVEGETDIENAFKLLFDRFDLFVSKARLLSH